MRIGPKLCSLLMGATMLVGAARTAFAKLRVVATIDTLADLCRQLGADRVDVSSLSHGYQDPHFVEAKPSLVLALNRADALVYVGLDLEVGWLPPLVQQSRNVRIQRGQPGNIDASTAIKVEDIPNVPADQLRALGDIHPLGNPHYWIPPENARNIARLLTQRFTARDGAGGSAYQSALAAFERKLVLKARSSIRVCGNSRKARSIDRVCCAARALVLSVFNATFFVSSRSSCGVGATST